MSISAGMQTLWPSFCSLTDIFLCQTLWRNHCAICHWSLVGLDPILGSAYMCIKKNLCPHDQLSFCIIGPQRVSDRLFCYHCSHSICKFEIDKQTNTHGYKCHPKLFILPAVFDYDIVFVDLCRVVDLVCVRDL